MPVKHFIVLLSIFAQACSTTITPLRSTANKLEAKIAHPEKGKVYGMSSTASEYGIVGKVQDGDEIISFDISRLKKELGKCYFFHDGKDAIPIKDKIFYFSNPAIKSYIQTADTLAIEESSLIKNNDLLKTNPAYRNDQCILLSLRDMPEKPQSACNSNEEETFSQSRCKNHTSSPTLWEKIKNWTRCVTITGVVTYVNPIFGLPAGLVCTLVSSNIDEENQYHSCISQARNDCRGQFNAWNTKVSNLMTNSNALYQSCLQTQKNIETSTVRKNELTMELDKTVQSWTAISEVDYCR